MEKRATVVEDSKQTIHNFSLPLSSLSWEGIFLYFLKHAMQISDRREVKKMSKKVITEAVKTVALWMALKIRIITSVTL